MVIDRRALGWLSLILILSLMGWGSVRLAVFSWNSVVAYRSPYLAADLPAPPSTPPLTDGVVLAVIEGLRRDAAAAATPTLNRMAAQGARHIVRTGEPSLSYPGWTVIGSGAWQGLSGVTTNWFQGPVPVDSIFREAHGAGLRVVGAGTGGWKGLFAPWFDRLEVPDVSPERSEEVDCLDEALPAFGLDLLEDLQDRLVLIYFAGPDEYGHAFGDASPSYRASVRRTDERLARVAAAMDLSRETLIVTTDHGHIDTGGHGGWEPIVKEVPLVMVGKGIRAGVEGQGTQADIAPTGGSAGRSDPDACDGASAAGSAGRAFRSPGRHRSGLRGAAGRPDPSGGGGPGTAADVLPGGGRGGGSPRFR
jgi:hypothetical protein